MGELMNIETQDCSCHFCGTGGLRMLAEYAKLHRVTSDCKPWPPGGGLGFCGHCGGAQAIMDKAWHDDAAKIYAAYTPYFQSDGVEQSVFDANSGAAVTRSQRLVQRVAVAASLAPNGRLLDIGCGNGALLRAFGASFKSWRMAGLEVHEHLRSVIEGIHGVEKLYTCSLAEVPGKFPLISLIHVLEHVPFPGKFLSEIREKLEPGGQLLIQVPDCAQNPFMFLVADHSSHFFLPVLTSVVEKAGFEIVVAANDWVAKELTVVARRIENVSAKTQASLFGSSDIGILKHSLEWLGELVTQSVSLSKVKPFGLFGTSIAASWLVGELNGEVDFFVDEDPNRQGKTYFNKPVYAPQNAPESSDVFIALPSQVAEGIRARMQKLGVKARFHAPKHF